MSDSATNESFEERTYQFLYILDGSKPAGHISAKDDQEAYAKLDSFLKEHPGSTFVKSSLLCLGKARSVADPPGL